MFLVGGFPGFAFSGDVLSLGPYYSRPFFFFLGFLSKSKFLICLR